MKLFITILLMLLIFLVFVFFISLFTHIRFRIEAGKDEKGNQIVIDLKLLFGIIHISKKLPWEKQEHPVPTHSSSDSSSHPQMNSTGMKEMLLHNKDRLIQLLSRVFHILREALAHIKIDELLWKSRIGTGEAADTGVLVGIAWSIKGSLVGYITSYLHLDTIPKIEIQPLFHEFKMETKFVLKARIRVAYALWLGLKLAIAALRSRKLIAKAMKQSTQSA